MKQLVLLLLFCMGTVCVAQDKTYEKAKKSYETGNLKAANKLIDKCLEDNSTKDNPNVLLLKSKIMYGISRDKDLREKFSGALKEAMKFAEKSVESNPTESARTAFKQENSEYLLQLVRQNNKEAIDAYNSERYAKALPLFKKSLYFAMDTQSLVYMAVCLWELNQESESIVYFRKAADMIYSAVMDSTSKVYGYYKEPFRKLGYYYFYRKKSMDTAYLYVKNGREIMPFDPELTKYTYALMKFNLDKIPPSEDYLSAVQSGLKDFPTDSFLNHRENAIYIFLLNGMATAHEQGQFDSLLAKYAASKVAKKKLKGIETIQRFDIFAGMEPAVFVERLKYYFADIGLPEASYHTAYYHFKMQQGTQPADALSFSNQYASAEPKAQVAEILFLNLASVYPKDYAIWKNQRIAYTAKSNKTTLGYFDLVPMIRLNDASAKDAPKDPQFKARAKEYRLRLIGETSDSGDFVLARSTWKESATLYPDQAKVLDGLWRSIVEKDFRMNYFGSRINLKGKVEKGVPVYIWNGNPDSCLAGSMSREIVGRVEHRINYFRRMAGLTEEIVLDDQDNEYCQIAVMMCEANKTMSHEPNDGWRCFIPAGADALKSAILTKDPNPAIAITAAMGQNHATVGNRRWLLYPRATYMGIGTSNTFTVIKAIDQSGELDTSKYKKQFVSWPPASYCPKLLVFKKWSFTLDADLKGATVTMKDGTGNAVALKLEEVSNGYGFNTLVWEPELTLASSMDYTVNIKLANGKNFQYKVNIIDITL